jgi:hypothetical protein
LRRRTNAQGRARRALATPIAWVAGAIIVAAFGVAVSVHGALLDIAKGLPVEVFDQEHDLQMIARDLVRLERTVQLTRLDPSQPNIDNPARRAAPGDRARAAAAGQL